MTISEPNLPDGQPQKTQSRGPAESTLALWISHQYGYRFFHQNLFTDTQWHAIVEIFERFYGLTTIECAMQYCQERARDGVTHYAQSSLAIRHDALDYPVTMLPGLSQLPNGQLSILEAAYEHLEDSTGMRKLLMYYLLNDCVEYRQYLPMLRELCADSWNAECSHLTNLFEHYGSSSRNRAYEYLLTEENLADAAWEYISTRRPLDFPQDNEEDSLLDSLIAGDTGVAQLFAIASKSNDNLLEQWLTAPLRDADAEVLRSNSASNRLRIATLTQLCCDLVSESVGHAQCNRLRAMYPKRKELQIMLDEVMTGTFDRRDVRWAERDEYE